MVALNCDDRGGTHSERESGVGIFESQPNGKSLRKPDPVQGRFHLRQSLNTRAVILVERPSHALHAAAESLVGVAEQVNFCAHLGPDMAQEVLSKIGQYIPRAIVDQT